MGVMRKWIRRYLSFIIIASLLVGAVPVLSWQPSPVQAQITPSSVIDYPPSITTNEEKLKACYSLMGQMIEEYNRQAGIAAVGKDKETYERKLRAYSWEYWTPVFSKLAQERNRLKLLIRKGSYDDETWEDISKYEPSAYDAICLELWGNKTAEQDKPTLATSDIFNTLKLINLDQIVGVDGTDPLEDFTTYTYYYDSVDGVTVNNSSQVRLGYPDDTRTRCFKSYLYKDKGSNYFDGDFTHRFRATWTSVEVYNVWETWMLANTVEDGKEMVDGSEDALWTSFSSSTGGSASVTYLRELNGGSFTSDSYTGSYTPEKFYTIVRDEGVGTYGELTMYICEDNYYGESSPSPDLKDTLVVTLTEKQDFRYVYMFNSYDTDTCPSSRIYDAYINDLDLDAAISSGTAPTVVTLAANETESTSSNMWGNITSVNNTNISCRGFGWDTTSRSEPDEDTDPASSAYANDWTQCGNYSTGTFNYSGATFTAATTYYFRAAANNTDNKWGWGDELSFLTKPAAPTNVAATDGTYTDKVRVTWNLSAGNISGYYVMYGGGTWLATVGNTTTSYNDTTAAAPTITPGTASASDGSSTAQVILSLSGEDTTNGAPRTYYLIAYNVAGNSTDSSTDSGYRGKSTLSYQWLRSSGDADSGYSSLAGATTDPYNDTTAPAPTITGGTAAASDGSSPLHVTLSLSGESGNNGAGRYYKCELSMADASSQNSTSDRGYRGTDSLSYQWYRSSIGACSGFSQIGGGTTDPYNDTAAPTPTIDGANATASDGTSSSYVTLSANETATQGDNRCYLCEVSMSGAASQNSSQNLGYRGTDTLSYQWWRSSGDAPSGYSQIGGGTTDPYNDTGGVVDPDGRYYLMTTSMSGATSQNSSADRGYMATIVPPTVVTLNPSLGDVLVNLQGNVTALNDTAINCRGFAWGTVSRGEPDEDTDPSASNYTNSWTQCGNYSTGTFNKWETVTAATTYYYRAAANNTDSKWGWGDEVSFLTLPAAPTGVTATDGTYGDKVVINWTLSAGNVTGYKVYRDAILIQTLGNVTGYEDTGADAPTINAGNTVASDGTFTDKVELFLSGEGGSDGTTHTYKVRAYNDSGDSTDSSTDTGYKGVSAFSYQWYVSSGVGCSGFSQIAGGTTEPYDHTGAPAPSINAGNTSATDGSSPSHVSVSTNEIATQGDSRCYLCEVSMSGAASQNSSTNTGYRGTDTLSYQWYQSSGDAPSGWSQVSGGTTDPYNDTTAPAPTIAGGNASASDGDSADYVTLSCNETANVGTGRYWLVEVSMSGATSQNSTSDRGYRGITTLTYQWWRSAGDSPASYSTIAGGTTDPYNDTGGAEAPDGRYYLLTTSMTGATSQNSSADRGYEQAADEPTIVTLNATNIACTTATLRGNVTDVTGGNATTRGFDYGLATGNYTLSTNETGNFGLGVYSLNVSSLSQNTTYYVRAFAVNGEGTGYGNETSFVTLAASLPIVDNSAAIGITDGEATLHGDITDTGCAGVNVATRGFEYGLSTGNYSWNWTEDGTFSTGAYNHEITGLNASTQYFWRALATNPAGTNYSAELTFNTTAAPSLPPEAPTDFDVFEVSATGVNITWTMGVNASRTIIKCSSNGYPATVNDGYLVYNGTGTSTSDSNLNLDISTYYYRAWSWNSIGYSIGYAQDNTGGGFMSYLGFFGLIALCAIVSWASLRTRFFLMKLLAGASWVAMWIYWMYQPPGVIAAGSPPHVAVMVVFIGLAIAIPIMGLGREIDTQKDWRGALTSQGSKAFKFELPSWLKTNQQEENRKQRRQNVEDYRERIRNAIRPRRKREI